MDLNDEVRDHNKSKERISELYEMLTNLKTGFAEHK